MNISVLLTSKSFLYIRELSHIFTITRNLNISPYLQSTKLLSPLSVSLTNCFIKPKYMDLTSVIKIFEEHVPPTLAESWDNTGLLIEPSNKTVISSILFTNDLTEDVLKEALVQKSDLIISYHPPIFSPLKSLRKSNWKDRIVIKCLENSVAVYSPHTSCDAVAGGVNDWLIKCFDLSDCKPILQSYEPQPKYSYTVSLRAFANANLPEILKSVPDSEIVEYRESPSSPNQDFKVNVNKASLNKVIDLITNVKENPISFYVSPLSPAPIPMCGMGRIGKLTQPITLGESIKMIKQYLNLNHIRFAEGCSHSLDTVISVIAVCAGSGSSVLKGVKADLYITGEMSHHDLLDANHRNVSVILCEHSNSERGYLHQLMKSLSSKLSDIKLIVSSSDKDPICIV